jgi:hypothetical protein
MARCGEVVLATDNHRRNRAMYSPDLTEVQPAMELPRWDRSEATATLSAYEQRPPWQSQRDFAAQAQVPRSTLQHWKARKDGLGLVRRVGHRAVTAG